MYVCKTFIKLLGFNIHHFHQPMIVPAHYTNYNCLDLNNRTDIHHHQHTLAHTAMPSHQTLASQTFIPSQNIIASQNIMPSQTIPVHPTAQSSLPIAHATQTFTMTGLQPSIASTKSILHHSNKHKIKQKRSIAEIDGECLMTNHLIEDQL